MCVLNIQVGRLDSQWHQDHIRYTDKLTEQPLLMAVKLNMSCCAHAKPLYNPDDSFPVNVRVKL